MKILKTYRFKNGAEVAHIEDYAEATRYSGIIRYFVVADSAKVEVGTFFDWKDAKEKALSVREPFRRAAHDPAGALFPLYHSPANLSIGNLHNNSSEYFPKIALDK